jgi:nitroreductase
MNPRAAAMSELLQARRSIRRYRDQPVDDAFVDDVLVQALQGSSSSGNLNMVSVIRTFGRERKAKLYELHFEQPMVRQAPLVLTFCADTYRTRRWLARRGARPGFADFISWHVAAFDALILAQTTALLLESHGLGICYMGTTLHAMDRIAERAVRGWERYRQHAPEVIARLEAEGMNSLAHFYTSKHKYDPDVFRPDSDRLHALLQARGFLP